MAYTNPTTRTVDEIISASIWNTDVVDNLKALKDPPSDHYELNEASDYTTTSTGFADVDGTNLALSITTTGGDVMVHFHGACALSASGYLALNLDVDGADTVADDGLIVVGYDGGSLQPVSFTRLISGLAAGAHTFKLRWKVSAGTATLHAGAGTANRDVHPQFWAREVS